MTNEAEHATATEAKKYFDLHVTGLGYLNRAREVEVTQGRNFLAVDISALHGAADAVQYTRFDCRVSGSEAEKVIRRCLPKIEADAKVLIGFRLSDVYPELFTYQSGEKEGQTGISLKARLLRVAWVKIDGEAVYTAPRPDDTSDAPVRIDDNAADQANQSAKNETDAAA